MNTLTMSTTLVPVLHGCDLCVAAESFYHADRVVDFHVLILVTEGVIHVTEETSGTFAVMPGDLLFLKAGVHHFGEMEIPKGTRWYYAHFFLDEQDDLPPFVPNPAPILQYEPVRYSHVLPKKLSGVVGSPIEEKFLALVNYFRSSEPDKRLFINLRLYELLSEIAAFGQKDVPETLSARICSYLEQHKNEPFASHRIEQEFFLSYKYLAAVFKREMGTSMQRYHTALRMEHACTLLRSTLLPVGEISSQLGYTDMLYFSRCFHQYTGQSPTAYRVDAVRRY